MGLLDKLVQEKNLDLEVISESGSTYLNLSELEKIQRLIQMDLLDESKLLQNLSDRYGLPLLSTAREEIQNRENPALTNQISEQTGILPVRLGTKLVGLLSGNSNRVATLIIALAETVDKLKTGRFADLAFSTDQLSEIRYASLLHDFGKIGL